MFLDDLEEAVSLLKQGVASETATLPHDVEVGLEFGVKTQLYLRELLTCVNDLRETETSSEAIARLDAIIKGLLEVQQRLTE
jgi:hypothetical protein